MELTVAELFAGVGGFRVGLNHVAEIGRDGRAAEKGGWKFVYANQYEPSSKAQHAFDCYAERFGRDGLSGEDIRLADKKKIPSHSLLVGGFPCQDYSVARTLFGEKGIEGKKGVLFWDIRDVLLAKKPPFVLLENVDRLLKSPASRRGRDFAVMLKTFDRLGYCVQWRVVNAAHYGMPQKRRRLFLFAYGKDTCFAGKQGAGIGLEENLFNREFKAEVSGEPAAVNLNEYADILEISEHFHHGKFLDCGTMRGGAAYTAAVKPYIEGKYPLGRIISQAGIRKADLAAYAVEEADLEKWRYLKGSKRIERTGRDGHPYIYSEGAMPFPDSLQEPARTLLTGEGAASRSSHIIFDAGIGRYRTLAPEECELIQMFPAGWTDTMPERKRYFVMGNALVTGIISRLEPKLREIVEGEEDDRH